MRRSTKSRPEVIATRAGLFRSARRHSARTRPVPSSRTSSPKKAGAPNFTGPARALFRRAHNDVGAGLRAQAPGWDVVLVASRDILARRAVPAPMPVVDGLRQASLRTVCLSQRSIGLRCLRQVPKGKPPAARCWVA